MEFDVSAYWSSLTEKEQQRALSKAAHARLLELLRASDKDLREAVLSAAREMSTNKIREALGTAYYDRRSLAELIRDAASLEARKQITTIITQMLAGMDVSVRLTKKGTKEPEVKE